MTDAFKELLEATELSEVTDRKRALIKWWNSWIVESHQELLVLPEVISSLEKMEHVKEYLATQLAKEIMEHSVTYTTEKSCVSAHVVTHRRPLK